MGLYFAFKLNYNKIIMCGVDLFGDHFCIDKRPVDQNIFQEKSMNIHFTNDSSLKHRIPSINLINARKKF